MKTRATIPMLAAVVAAMPTECSAFDDDDDLDPYIDDAVEGVREVGAADFKQTTPEVRKRAPLGFGAFSMLTATTLVLTAKVQRKFGPDKLLITSSAIGLLITSLKIGDVEQLLNGSVPVELYGTAALADPNPDDFSACRAAGDIVITLSNPTAGTITGAAAMKGQCRR